MYFFYIHNIILFFILKNKVVHLHFIPECKESLFTTNIP